MNIDEFAEEFSTEDSVYTFDWPLEIMLEDYKPDSTFKGSVRLAHLGWTEIDTTANPSGNAFIVDTKSKLGPVEYIVFNVIKITSDSLVGAFAGAGPIIGDAPLSFRAERIR